MFALRSDGTYAWELGELVFAIDPAQGGRITEVSLGGNNALTGSTHPNINGSTFWPSPQVWPWPPPAALDTDPYAAAIEGDAVVLTSGVEALADAEQVSGSIRIVKRFRPLVEVAAVEVRYSIENVGSTSLRWAPWEISRVPARGVTFFPTGRSEGPKLELAVHQQAGITWYQNDPQVISLEDGQKYVADGAEGWLAHVAGALLLLKQFEDIPPGDAAPGEGEIELYASHSSRGPYVEIEQQGPYRSIAPGSRLDWTVRWALRKIPASIDRRLGSTGLVELARTVAAQLAAATPDSPR